MARQTYVIEYDAAGKPVCKPGSTLFNWIPREQAKYGPQTMGSKTSHMIIEDIQPYVSTIDGSVIGSRSKHRKHLREHGCVEVGTESMDKAQDHFQKDSREYDRQRKEQIVETVNRAFEGR